MNHRVYYVTTMKIVAPYTLFVQFDDGKSQTINFRTVLKGEMYSPLLDLSLFNKVRIDSAVHTLVWPNGADFDPATLHDWPDFEEEFKKQAENWTAI